MAGVNPAARGSEVAWEEVQEALVGWTNLEAYLPESCLRHLRETENEVKKARQSEVERTAVGDRPGSQPSTSGAPSNVQYMQGWLESLLRVGFQSDEEAARDVKQIAKQPRLPLGSWEGIAYLRETLGPILQGSSRSAVNLPNNEYYGIQPLSVASCFSIKL
eukprot:3256841-Pyramimonas_sp.AAC.6